MDGSPMLDRSPDRLTWQDVSQPFALVDNGGAVHDDMAKAYGKLCRGDEGGFVGNLFEIEDDEIRVGSNLKTPLFLHLRNLFSRSHDDQDLYCS